jgi:crotonobetainyl-CoA:carnitine CoA-transferase CaiB-like acyl-CoA transferase
MTAPLDGLRVVDLSNTLTGTQMSQLLADFGADVVHVEPPGGSPLRSQAAWPFWARGKRSIVVDLGDVAEREVARSLASAADVVIETWRPGVAERLGLGYEQLATANPGLVYASVTGFGRDNPLSNMKAYEPIVMAKIGGLDAFSPLSDRPGPSFVTTPYCSWSAGQLALQAILAALVEREASGVGQRVESTLVQGILAHDTWNWVLRMIAQRYSGAFTATPPTNQDELIPNSGLFFRLLVGLSADGRWMQFSQTTERLWQAFLRATGLAWTQDDPRLKDAANNEDPKIRVEFWEMALAAVRSKTYDEWLVAFDEEPDVWAELYRSGTELLHHPQMVHDRRTIVIDDPAVGPVLQPGPLVQMDTTPAELGRPAPALDEHGTEIRGEAAKAVPSSSPSPSKPPTTPPLAGVTVLELGTFYAAPFGATILTDYGARVIKVEQLDGDPMRNIMPFPEVGGIKVLQGKESVAVDMASEEGREIVLELVRRSDVVLQTFRAGVAERHGYTAADLLAVKPELVYLNAPGYGIDGPCGHRPAFAPTMGAGAGLGYRNVGGPANLPQGPDLTLNEVKRYGMRLSTAALGVGHADGFSALGVGTALLVGLLAKRRGGPGQSMMTSMLSTMAHTLSEDMVEYEGRPAMSTPDKDLYGLGPLYRLYETAEGWVFLAAPAEDDWSALRRAMGLDEALRSDAEGLTAALGERFMTKAAEHWERELTALDVACVAVAPGPVEEVVMLGGGLGRELGIVTDTTHPVIGDYPRLTPLARFSRSAGVTGHAPLCGEHTDAVLDELGYDAERIGNLRDKGVIG